MVERAPKALPGGPREALAPTTTAPVTASRSPAAVLALQRSVGNRATVAIMRTWAPPAQRGPIVGDVVHRAWVPTRLDPETSRWDDDEQVGGLDWWRRETPGQPTAYWFMGGDDVVAGYREQEHDAGWWAAWEHAAGRWIPALAGAPVGAGAGVAAPAAAAPAEVAAEAAAEAPGPAGPEVVADVVHADAAPAAAAAAAADVPAVVAERKADPTITSGRAPQYAPGGCFSWPVTMRSSVAALPVDSWIIQKVVMAIDGSAAVTFWEAFGVPAGSTAAEHGDIYVDPEAGGAVGHSTVRGVMQHHVFAGGGRPPLFGQGVVRESDGEQWATYDRPGFWADAGAQHDIDVTWDDGGVTTITTVPDGGAFTRKADSDAFTA